MCQTFRTAEGCGVDSRSASSNPFESAERSPRRTASALSPFTHPPESSPCPGDEAGKLQLHVVVHSFIQGLAVNVEAEAQAVAESGVTDAEYMHAVDAKYRDAAETGRYPFFTKVTRGVPDSLDMGVDAIFELGLRAILDGFAPLIESSR